jgi:hypothetical protein
MTFRSIELSLKLGRGGSVAGGCEMVPLAGNSGNVWHRREDGIVAREMEIDCKVQSRS